MNYPTYKESSVAYEYRSKDENTCMLLPLKNRGLFSGPQVMEPSVVPTTTNYMLHNLNSAKPPPGAQLHYPGTLRLGNNYQAMPGVYWYTDVDPKNKGPFNLKGLQN